MLPRHLLRAASSLPDSFLSSYSPADASRVLTINKIQAPGLISLGLGLCRDSLGDLLGEQEAQGLDSYLQRLGDGVETRLIRSGLAGDLVSLVALLPSLFPKAGLKTVHTSSLAKLVGPFSVGELVTLLGAARQANLTDKDLKVLEEVAKTSVEDLANVERVLMKINFENLPEISRLLDLLGIQLTDLITNPGIFFEFFGDEEKSAILVELQTLLPKFRPADIEVFLNLQTKLDEAQLKYGDPEDDPVMQKLFKIPIDTLLSAMPKLKLDASANAGFDAFKLLMEDEDFKTVSAAGSALLDEKVLKELVERCTAQQFDVEYRDEERVGHLADILVILLTSWSLPRTCVHGAT